MLTHGNILAMSRRATPAARARRRSVPFAAAALAHVRAHGGYYLPLFLGAKVAYARSISQLAEDLASQRPTIMFAVPRVFEKFAARVGEALAKAPFKKRLFDLVVAAGRARLAARPGSSTAWCSRL